MTLRERLKLAWAVLRGRQTWPDDYPTPWAYEAAAHALSRRHEQLRGLLTDDELIEEVWNAKRRDDIRRSLAKRTAT